MTKIKSFIKALLENKRATVILSIVSAFIIWLIVTINQKPIIGRTLTDISVNINLENTYVAENEMSIIGDISQQKFTVSIRGPRYQVSSLTTEDINLYASAASVNAPGEYDLKVAPAALSEGTEWEILNISPAVIKVNFDYIDTEEFTITASAVGAVAEEGLIAENGVVGGAETDTVTIKGPRSVISLIDKVVATAQVNKTLKESETFNADIFLYDVDGNEISKENLSLSTANVKVTVPVSKKKTVPVVVDFSHLPEGFDKSSIKATLDHSKVTIIGTPEAIEKTTQVTLSPIDITTVTAGKNRFEVSAKLTEGIRLLDKIEFFTVSLDLSGYEEKIIPVVTNAKFKGLGSGLTTKENTVNIKNVKIFGPRAVVRKIDAEDIVAIMDMTDKKAGEHSVNAVFTFGNNNNVWQIDKYTTTVIVK